MKEQKSFSQNDNPNMTEGSKFSRSLSMASMAMAARAL
jgi:hypothetical protein